MTLAAEFPNDNPDLHEGAIWVCLEVTGLPVAERPRMFLAPEIVAREIVTEPRPSGIFVIETFSSLREEDEDEEEPILVEELAPLEDVVEEIVALPVLGPTAPAPAPIEPSVVTEQDPYAALMRTLVEVALGQGATGAAAELPAMLEQEKGAEAWAGILRGTSEDWDAVGGMMLDEWAADVLSRLLGASERVQQLKSELRARGVAAFGLAA